MNFLLPSFQTSCYKKIGMEEMVAFVKNPSPTTYLINTLPLSSQQCLIKNTMNATTEESTFNRFIEDGTEHTITVYVYGLNCHDDTVDKKYNAMKRLGFNVFVYMGGLFEWLLLQDIYGKDEFPTTSACRDILRFR